MSTTVLTSPYCDTALHWSSYYNNPIATRMLLDGGADGYLKNYSGTTPLMDAEAHCNESYRMILEHTELTKVKQAKLAKFHQNLCNNKMHDLNVVVTLDSAADFENAEM